MSVVDPRSHDLPQIIADMHNELKSVQQQLATLRSQTTLDHGTMKNINNVKAHPQYDFGHFDPYGTQWWCDTTAPFLGNGTLIGRACVINKLVFFYMFWQAGSTTTFGAGNWNFALPLPMRSNGFIQQIHAWGGDLFVVEYHGAAIADKNDGGMFGLPQAVQVELYTAASGMARVNSGYPHTWGNGDYIQLQGWYEAA